MAHELGKGIDEYLSTHSRLQHAAWCEFFLESGVWVRKDDDSSDEESSDEEGYSDPLCEDEIPDGGIDPETQAYIEGGYPSPPENISPTSEVEPYSSPLHKEMTRRFYEQRNKKRTPREQFEIDKTKAAWAVRLTPRDTK